jgi:metal-responsive CopG/Arc/MetJ family transcriptional regulator
MTDAKTSLSEELLQQVEETAIAQNRKPAELLEEAVREYLQKQSWVQFVERNEQRARAKGIGEEDVERLIAEVRSENAQNRR